VDRRSFALLHPPAAPNKPPNAQNHDPPSQHMRCRGPQLWLYHSPPFQQFWDQRLDERVVPDDHVNASKDLRNPAAAGGCIGCSRGSRGGGCIEVTGCCCWAWGWAGGRTRAAGWGGCCWGCGGGGCIALFGGWCAAAVAAAGGGWCGSSGQAEAGAKLLGGVPPEVEGVTRQQLLRSGCGFVGTRLSSGSGGRQRVSTAFEEAAKRSR